MILEAFSVYDSAAEAYLEPFFMRTRGEALRAFKTAANEESHQFSKHADDYTLFHVGSFDQAMGQLIPATPPVSMGSALQFREVARKLEAM